MFASTRASATRQRNEYASHVSTPNGVQLRSSDALAPLRVFFSCPGAIRLLDEPNVGSVLSVVEAGQNPRVHHQSVHCVAVGDVQLGRLHLDQADVQVASVQHLLQIATRQLLAGHGLLGLDGPTEKLNVRLHGGMVAGAKIQPARVDVEVGVRRREAMT